ncbi:MAG TPA: hypothetical protein VGT99_00970 [Gammaproteobacteria bacterium]|nr:hypothetical protein [Gammaproteobacteria bacterium]
MHAVARNSCLGIMMACAMQAGLAADPGESWFTEGAGSGNPPDGVQWLAPQSLCRVLPARLAQAVQVLEARSFTPLTARSLPLYAAASCKGKYGQSPYLVRAVSAAGEGRLDAGLQGGELWMRYAGLGGKNPFEKTPVILWLSSPPLEVHISASIVE